MRLVEYVLEGGLDPVSIEAPRFEEWPRIQFFHRSHAADVCFIEYFASLTRNNTGLYLSFLGISSVSLTPYSGCLDFHPLHEASLRENPDKVRTIISQLKAGTIEQRNFLGQTPLHLAIKNVEIVRLVLDAGHSIDAIDRQGITPLMYAASYGCTSTAVFLISRGADPTMTVNLDSNDSQENFLHIALKGSHTDFVVKTLREIHLRYGRTRFAALAPEALLGLLMCERDYYFLERDASWEYCFDYLVRECHDVNFPFNGVLSKVKDCNLMRYVGSLTSAKLLVELGYNRFDSPNGQGELVTHTFAREAKRDLLQLCLSRGVDVNYKDRFHRPILWILVSRLRKDPIQCIWRIMECIKLCFEYGADVSLTDECQCSCAPGGCSISSALATSAGMAGSTISLSDGAVWMLELTLLVREHQGDNAAKRMLCAFIRQLVANRDDIAITHVCCHRGREFWWEHREDKVKAEDVLEILEEEGELIAVLDEDMANMDLEMLSIEDLQSKWIGLYSDYLENFEGPVLFEWENTLNQVRTCLYTSTAATGTGNSIFLIRSSSKVFKVDHQNDVYHLSYNLAPAKNSADHLAQSVAVYSLWLEHELVRRRLRVGCQGQEWYLKRIPGIMELMEAFRVTPEDVAREMREWGDCIPEMALEREKVNANTCSRHFLKTTEQMYEPTLNYHRALVELASGTTEDGRHR